MLLFRIFSGFFQIFVLHFIGSRIFHKKFNLFVVLKFILSYLYYKFNFYYDVFLLNADGTQFASAGKDTHVRIYDEATKAEIACMRGKL